MKGADIPVPYLDLARQREVVDAFFAAARGGDFDALVALLDPDVVLRSDFGAKRAAAPRVTHGAATSRQLPIGIGKLFQVPPRSAASEMTTTSLQSVEFASLYMQAGNSGELGS